MGPRGRAGAAIATAAALALTTFGSPSATPSHAATPSYAAMPLQAAKPSEAAKPSDAATPTHAATASEAAKPSEAAAAPSEASADARTDELFTLINRARLAHAVPPMARAPELDAAADSHSRDMVAHDYLDHDGSDGSTPQQRAEQAGYTVPPHSAWIVVEVISAISAEPAGPLDWWLNQSPDVHGKVLLDPRWREMGLGYAAGGEYGNYWTVMVGCRPHVLPTVTVDGQTYATHEQCGDPGAIRPTLEVPHTTVNPGADLEVRWSNIASPAARDWLGLYKPADADDAYRTWSYVSCAWMPLGPRPDGWCSLHVPSDLAPGTYELRLHADDGYTVLAASPAVTVAEPH